jgi:TDG/mug DNA glycosylase family protein
MPVLPDLLRPGLRLVICGSAAGTVSARRGAYYAGPGNRFWPILAETGLTPRRLRPDEFTLLPVFGIGLTDLAKHAFGADTAIRRGDYDPDGLLARLRACRPGVLAFNGKRAAAVFLGVPSGALSYGPAPAPPGCPPVHVLPSTSGAASGRWDASYWHALARAVSGAELLP